MYENSVYEIPASSRDFTESFGAIEFMREVFAHVTHELDGAETHEPFGVVAHERATPTREVKEALQLVTNAADVLLDHLQRVERPLARPAAGIPDHARTAAHERNRPMAGSLQMSERHHRDEVSKVKAACGGIEAAVGYGRSSGEHPLNPFGVLIEQPAPRELVDKCQCAHGGKIPATGEN